jgi:hypothetical protein
MDLRAFCKSSRLLNNAQYFAACLDIGLPINWLHSDQVTNLQSLQRGNWEHTTPSGSNPELFKTIADRFAKDPQALPSDLDAEGYPLKLRDARHSVELLRL